MIMPDYQVGQYVRLEPFQDGADDIRCVCDPVEKPGGKPPDLTASELGECWHGAGTKIVRVFKDGGLLLENRFLYVRVARPDEVASPKASPKASARNQRRRERYDEWRRKRGADVRPE